MLVKPIRREIPRKRKGAAASASIGWVSWQLIRSFALSLAKYDLAYGSYLKAQRILARDSLDLMSLIHAFGNVPRLAQTSVIFGSDIGARETMSNFVLLAGTEFNFDCEYTLPVLMEAIIKSGRTLESFEIANGSRDRDFVPRVLRHELQRNYYGEWCSIYRTLAGQEQGCCKGFQTILPKARPAAVSQGCSLRTYEP